MLHNPRDAVVGDYFQLLNILNLQDSVWGITQSLFSYGSETMWLTDAFIIEFYH